MVDYIELGVALRDTIADIPAVVTEMAGDAERIAYYVDVFPVKNSLALAVYRMPAPSILIAWTGTTIGDAETMTMWEHEHHIYVRAATNRSALAVIHEIVDGKPEKFNGLRLRDCGVLPEVNPLLVTQIARVTDEESIDYFDITGLISETGDYMTD